MDWVRLLWAGTLLNASGLIGLTLALDGRVKIVLFVSGLLLEGAFVFVIFLAHKRIEALITKLEETA